MIEDISVTPSISMGKLSSILFHLTLARLTVYQGVSFPRAQSKHRYLHREELKYLLQNISSNHNQTN